MKEAVPFLTYLSADTDGWNKRSSRNTQWRYKISCSVSYSNAWWYSQRTGWKAICPFKDLALLALRINFARVPLEYINLSASWTSSVSLSIVWMGRSWQNISAAFEIPSGRMLNRCLGSALCQTPWIDLLSHGLQRRSSREEGKGRLKLS